MPAHGNFFKVLAAAYRQHNGTFFVHNVNRAEVPAVKGNGSAVLFGSIAPAFVQGVCFNYIAVGHMCLKRLYHFARQNVRAVRFAGMQFNCNLAVNAFVNHIIKFNKSISVYVFAEIYFGTAACAAVCGNLYASFACCKHVSYPLKIIRRNTDSGSSGRF